jgi:hypothetical protein
VLKSSTYYMNNRKAFKTKINSLLYPTRANWKPRRRHRRSQIGERGFELLTHQKIVRDLNIDTPYRGLLLYHGLGSGKTCTSIIAEGMKSEKHVFVRPPRLRDNFSGVEEVRRPSSKKEPVLGEDTVGGNRIRRRRWRSS